MIKLIIFDFDGVIVVGSNEEYFRCYHEALEKVGVHLDSQEERKRILERWSQPYQRELAGLLREYPQHLEKAVEAFEQCYYSPELRENIKLVKGTKDALENLSRKYTLAIASGMYRKMMDPLIEKFGIPYFKKIITNEDINKKEDFKPAPFMISKIMNDLSISQSETIMVGDGKNDVLMAQNAGIIPVVVLTGHLNKKEAEELE